MGLTPGEIFAGLGSAAGVGISGAFSAASARQQMRFQERMRDTAWQAAVKDMRLAGINPMIAFSQGAAQSPSGAAFEVGDVAGPAVSSAMHARRLNADLHMMRQQQKLMAAQADNVKADTVLKDITGFKVLTDAQMARLGWPGRIAGYGIGSLISGGAMSSIEALSELIAGFRDFKGLPFTGRDPEETRIESEDRYRIREAQARRNILRGIPRDVLPVRPRPRSGRH